METVSFKVDNKLLKEIDKKMKKDMYSTRTEFIRDAIRDKLSELEFKEVWERFDQIRRKNKHKTTDEDLHKAREKAFEDLEKELR